MSVRFFSTVKSSLLTKTGHNRLMKELHREIMEWLAAENLPKKFKNVPETYGGSGGYRFARRRRAWNEIKERVFRRRAEPNVLTGTLEERILSSITITATSGRGRLKAKGRVGRDQIPLPEARRRELEAVSNKEIRTALAMLGREYRRRAASAAYAPMRRVRRSAA